MHYVFESSLIWKNTLGINGNHNIDLLRESFLSSRKKIGAMLENIESEIKGLTVHDVTHLDSLWLVSDQIIGNKSYLNPAEAYVLGCVFLLHDAAHVSAAYKGGLKSLKETDEWKDLVGLRFNNIEPNDDSDEYALLLFEVARIHHARQAREITKFSWKDQSNGSDIYFIDNAELRSEYSEVIGLIAESHNWSPEKVFNQFQHRKINPPGFLNEKDWEVDCLKIAIILRTSDASHIDSRRAPTYLFSFLKPQGLSREHWLFQNKLSKAMLASDSKLRITSGSSFNETERKAWWLAFDTAKMIDKELKAALFYLNEGGREPLSAQSVLGIESPASFSSYVTVSNWEPEDTSIHISNLPHLIKTLGGNALYGNDETVVFRELIQNSIDSINAGIALGYLNPNEGVVRILIEDSYEDEDEFFISIIDNGIGMSKYVLTNVLLDFGNSLWKSNNVVYEHPTLPQKNFKSVGKFGIGFYSVFMISDFVEVITRRYELHHEETNLIWKLKFEDGLHERPYISAPDRNESLKRHGTKVKFSITKDMLFSIIEKDKVSKHNFEEVDEKSLLDPKFNIKQIISYLFPVSGLNMEVERSGDVEVILSANDWMTIDYKSLLGRRFLSPRSIFRDSLQPIYSNGELIGRLSVEPFGYYNNSANHAVVCHGGIRAGKIYGVSGFCITNKNNERAERTDCLPEFPIQSWIDWALLTVNENPNTNSNCLLRLNPLIPNEDLKVWHLNESRCFLQNILDFCNDKNEILIHVGNITYSGDDNVSESAFDEDFVEIENLVLAPDNRYASYSEDARIIDFLSTLTKNKIEYIARLREKLKTKFQSVSMGESNEIVGFVDNTEISRPVIIFHFE